MTPKRPHILNPTVIVSSIDIDYRTYERGKEKKPIDVKVIIMFLRQ